jgi:S1-C subfamily serine protease
MKKFLHCILICILASGVTSCKKQDGAQFSPQTLEESCVRIMSFQFRGGKVSFENGDLLSAGSGSGFVVGSKGHVVTNHHVIDGATHILLMRKKSGKTLLYSAKVIKEEEHQDLALLSSSIQANGLPINMVDADKLAKVHSIGYPAIADAKEGDSAKDYYQTLRKKMSPPDPGLQGDGVDITRDLESNKAAADRVNATFTSGTIRRYSNQAFGKGWPQVYVADHDLNIGHGNSGGPLVDDGGNVVGVVGRGMIKTSEENQADIDKINWAISSKELIALLEANKASYSTVKIGSSDLHRMPMWKMVTISIAGALAAIALGLSLFLMSRRNQTGVQPSVTQLVRAVAGRMGAETPSPRQPQGGGAGGYDPTSLVEQPRRGGGGGDQGIIWELDINGPNGFRQILRMTDDDFRSGRGRVVIGRSAEFSQLAVRHDSVSRQHLQFEHRNGSLTVADRNSSNGTKLNQRALPGAFQEMPIREGDTLQFGELTAKLRRGF